MAAGSYLLIAFIIILIQLTITPNSCLATIPSPPTTAVRSNIRFIRTFCRATLYPSFCLAKFSRYATKIRGNPRLMLTTTALSVALNTTRSTERRFKYLSKLHGLKGKQAAALRDCVQQLGEAIGELKDSMSEMGGRRKDFLLRMSNIQTWVSAALTNDGTCLDGFSWKAGKPSLKIRVRRMVLKVAHLTSIALAFVNRFAAAMT